MSIERQDCVVWVKKTIWRRYIVNKDDTQQVVHLLKLEKNIEIIEDVYDINKDVEYDNEELFNPIEYEIQELKKDEE